MAEEWSVPDVSERPEIATASSECELSIRQFASTDSSVVATASVRVTDGGNDTLLVKWGDRYIDLRFTHNILTIRTYGGSDAPALKSEKLSSGFHDLGERRMFYRLDWKPGAE